jgi:transposase InsO family protein
VIATVARLLCRELTLQNEYLRLENRVLKEKVSGRIRFTDEERRCLSEAALAMGRSLMEEVVSIVKPETILAWQQFLSRHAEVMLCADLFTKEVWTLSGLRTAYVLFVLHLGTRRILLAEATFAPNGLWMGQMARNLLMSCEDLEIAPRFVLHDRDKLLACDFDAVLTTAQAKVVKTPFRAPDANAHAERWVGSVTGECLDHLILFGMSSLQRALRVYCDFFNGHRPHQGIGNRIPERPAAAGIPRDCAGAMTDGDLAVEYEQFLGGLLNSYYRKAA